MADHELHASPWGTLLEWLGPSGREALASGVDAVGKLLTAPYRYSEQRLNPPFERLGQAYGYLSPQARAGLRPEAAERLRNVPVGQAGFGENSGRPYYSAPQDAIFYPDVGDVAPEVALHEAAHALDLTPGGLLGQTALGRYLSLGLRSLGPGRTGAAPARMSDDLRQRYGASPGEWFARGDEEEFAMIAANALHGGVAGFMAPAYEEFFTPEFIQGPVQSRRKAAAAVLPPETTPGGELFKAVRRRRKTPGGRELFAGTK